MLVLAEPHFGATWTVFFDKKMRFLARENFFYFIIIPFIIFLSSLVLFLYAKNLFFLLFFLFNIYHVTRQSAGICKLYSKNLEVGLFQERFLYIFNALVFLGILLFHLLKIISVEQAQIFGFFMFLAGICICLFQYFKYKNIENSLITFTGLAMFIPGFFVNEAIHALLAGITMHYTQYLALTMKLTLSKLKNNIIDNKVLGIKSYFLLILTYGIIATGLTMFASKNNQEQVFSTLIFFPILGQILHFYIDGLIWKFRDKNIREINLSYLLNETK